MNPIVVGGPFERLARVDWSIHLLLLLAVELGRLSGFLDILTFPLAILFRHLLLVVCELWLFHKVVLSVVNRTQDTLVVLQITLAHICK